MLSITRIDTRVDDADAEIAALREKLSPRGDIVSEAGKKRTQAVFGEPLTAGQVVQRVCNDVRKDGIA
ncbi:MAG: histidinol dehydrogenase, partial [bacterium]|nr:histidinol dehydrogenase [bacterium]